MTPELYALAKSVFLEAVDLSREERADFLDQRCSEYPELRAEVESLLKYDDSQTLIPSDYRETNSNHPDTVTSQNSQITDIQLTKTNFKRTLKQMDIRGHLALGFAVATILQCIFGLITYQAIKSSLLELERSTLDRIVDTNAIWLTQWIERSKKEAEQIGLDPTIVNATEKIIAELQHANTDSESEASIAKMLADSPDHKRIMARVANLLGEKTRFAIWDNTLTTIVDWNRHGLGVGVTSHGGAVLTEVFDGKTVMLFPGRYPPITKGYPISSVVRKISLLTPIQDASNKTIAVLLLYNYDLEDSFNKILSVTRVGNTGDTFAFNRDGLMISESRFTDQFLKLGLIPKEDPVSRCNVVLRDPGKDLTKKGTSKAQLKTHPMTKMVRYAIEEKDSSDVNGYRDSRGIIVFGAWRWLDDYNIGIAAEIAASEAYGFHHYIQLQTKIIIGLLLLSLFVALGFYLTQRKQEILAAESPTLGQYILKDKIDEGGMGVIYEADHQLLKRPTAIKLLKPDITNEKSVKWFEREVQLASQLTHTNTIDIYDYGVTPDGTCFFAMEYVSGFTLKKLVKLEGDLPVNRAAYLIRQVCYSLREAHLKKMIHRDIKPHNIMICERGGDLDVVKVLDFGLAKVLSSGGKEDGTVTAIFAGTPLYMSPERLRDPYSVDVRTDVYSVGAVFYKLVTGQDLFFDAPSGDTLFHVLNTKPTLASTLAGQPIPLVIDQLIANCLLKNPKERIESVDIIIEILDAYLLKNPWTQAKAKLWWKRNISKK